MVDILTELNPAQREAVKIIDGPVLVLAGPGSGKTRVLTHRVAYLIHEGRVPAHRILAVTFTNKAAREMRLRLVQLLGEERVRDLTIGTFHATCARFLRRDGERVGLGRNFVIYDEEDQTRLIKQVIKELNLDDKIYRPGVVLGTIGKAKNELIGPDEYVPPSYWHEGVQRAYQLYQRRLSDNNAVDFDDLLLSTVRLFRENRDVLERYQNRYHYLHVDEFQDTNMAQYVLVKLLADKHHNLFCVGDEDQSIYGWRGADYRNVLRFREDFPNARVVLLEQNYRSTQTIVEVAQSIIGRNVSRHKKKLWTENPRGIPINIYEAYNEEEEADFVVGEIDRLTKSGGVQPYRPSDFAVFYRTNAQSRVLENAFLRRGMPYNLVGATRFYQRREVKDVIAYLRLIHNPNDSIAFQRVLNVPPRGIGKRTMDEVALWSERLAVTPYAVLERLKEISGLEKEKGQVKTEKPKEETATLPSRFSATFDTRTRRALLAFADLLDELVAAQADKTIVELIDLILSKTGYEDYVRDGTEEGDDRWANVIELRKATQKYAVVPAEVALVQFLEEEALIADVDAYDETVEAPTLMTLHTAKGLEFRVVFIVGLEEGLFPHSRSFDDPAQMEEERRLCYVGITRSKERLYLLYAFRRSSYGSSEPGDPSRFLADIPRNLISGKSVSHKADQWEDAGDKTSWRSKDRDNESRAHDDEDEFESKRERPVSVRRSSPPVRPLPTPVTELEFKPGDKVEHPAFGSGVVVTSKMTGADEEVEVAFVGKGVKRLIVRYANLIKK
ncbi:MAG: UvrD-helicase domain-containing protein [Chloroflexi bacterium]|nr:UvrD-helicase domain-containing protein [Chloroflexota bacterium]